MKTSTPSVLITFALVCFALVQNTQAVSPPPDGGYPGGNTAEGQAALLSLTTGGFNTAVGFSSLRSDTTNSFNTAIGAGTLLANTADENTATGAGALFSNTTGSFNTANGAFALFSNTTGSTNTATGIQALFSNTTGAADTATGDGALQSNTAGNSNTATGASALLNNTTGNNNTANGAFALNNNTTGPSNTANGADALLSNTTGSGNTAIGSGALQNNSTGGDNIALGTLAGINVTTATGVISIGADGNNVPNSCFIGRIRGATTVNNDAIPVVIDSAGQLGTMSSSARYKKAIKPMDEASEAILLLKPVTFHYKSDNTNRTEFGLIAEEVAQANPNLVVHDKNGDIYTVRYDAVNAMLLNEFLKEHRTVQALKKEIAALAATVKEQMAQIQKVSAQLQVSDPAPQTVLNNQ